MAWEKIRFHEDDAIAIVGPKTTRRRRRDGEPMVGMPRVVKPSAINTHEGITETAAINDTHHERYQMYLLS